MPGEKILIVDDDQNICELLKTFLDKEGYNTIISNNGQEAMVKFNTLNPDVLILDVMIPGGDGLQLCKEIRNVSDVPIIMISARSEILDKVLALELGADDYIIKPFDTKEVIARVKAVTRRWGKSMKRSEKKIVNYDNLSVDLNKYVLMVKNEIIEAPPKEIELLYCLASSPNIVFTRDQLLDEVWGVDYYGDSRTIDVHIKRLRAKISGASDKWRLKTIWSVGYMFELSDSSSDKQ